MSEQSVILTGASGYLGHYLAKRLAGCSEVTVRTLGRGAEADIRHDLRTGLDGPARAAVERADVVVNLAALSSMGACAEDPVLARCVNAEVVGELARTAKRLVQVSTDLVFDGRDAPYLPTATVHPRSVYGASKAGGEAAVLEAGGEGLVVRLPLLFGRSHDGRRGATDMLRSAVDGGGLALFTDEFRTPLHVADAADALARWALSRRSGVVHVAGPERLSRYELGERFARVHGWTSLPWGIGYSAHGGSTRPRDVSLISDLVVGRSLDAALETS